MSSGTLLRTASRRLLELLQTRLAAAPPTASLSALLHLVQQDCVALSANACKASRRAGGADDFSVIVLSLQ